MSGAQVVAGLLTIKPNAFAFPSHESVSLEILQLMRRMIPPRVQYWFHKPKSEIASTPFWAPRATKPKTENGIPNAQHYWWWLSRRKKVTPLPWKRVFSVALPGTWCLWVSRFQCPFLPPPPASMPYSVPRQLLALSKSVQCPLPKEGSWGWPASLVSLTLWSGVPATLMPAQRGILHH